MLLFEVGGGRSQFVSVMGTEHQDRPWATVWTTVCSESQVDFRDALMRNVGLPGGIALLDDGSVIFKYSFPLSEIDPSEIESAFAMVVEYGDYLEQQITGADEY